MATATEPNLFELQGGSTKVTYSTSSISGKPLIDLRQGRKTMNFSGNQIRVDETPIGRLVTVTTETIPDSKVVTFSLLLPAVNLQTATKVNIKAVAIVTTAKTSIGGPKLVKGALQSYKTTALSGTAKLVEF